jgi:hypothetical protein
MEGPLDNCARSSLRGLSNRNHTGNYGIGLRNNDSNDTEVLTGWLMTQLEVV